ncbi:MAG: urease accessory protein UreD [Cyanobacteria bacterium J06639_14]
MGVSYAKQFKSPSGTAPTTALTASDTLQLYLNFGCDRHQQTFVAKQYTAYPFRLSRVFRLDATAAQRAYLYLMNSSPGLLAGDDLHIGLDVGSKAQVYLTDQAATKIHTSPLPDLISRATYHITVDAEAYLEFVPEPIILYANASFEQLTDVRLHPTSRLCLSEIILPGRLARSEFYDFHYYLSRLRVRSPDGNLIFGDAMRLEGHTNPLQDSLFFAEFPVIANIILVLPGVDLESLIHAVEVAAPLNPAKLDHRRVSTDDADSAPNQGARSGQGIISGCSILPNCNGLLVRVMGTEVDSIKTYSQYIFNCVRQATGQPDLPNIPK